MSRFGILQLVTFFIYLFFQVIFLKDLSLFGVAFCFIYIGYLLRFPVETNPLALMAIGVALGLSIDVFYGSVGFHASASVLMTYGRKFWLNRVTPQGGYDANEVPSLRSHGLSWFLIYILPLIFIHHATLFFVEVGMFQYFWFTLLKVVASTIFTGTVIVINQYLFSRKL